jgi:hypothetical protein
VTFWQRRRVVLADSVQDSLVSNVLTDHSNGSLNRYAVTEISELV